MHILTQLFIFTCSFCVHLDSNDTQVGCANAHTSTLLLSFGLCSSHLFDGVDAHDGHSVAWDHTVTQVPEKREQPELSSAEHTERCKIPAAEHSIVLLYSDLFITHFTCRSRAEGDVASLHEAQRLEIPAGVGSESQHKRSDPG